MDWGVLVNAMAGQVFGKLQANSKRHAGMSEAELEHVMHKTASEVYASMLGSPTTSHYGPALSSTVTVMKEDSSGDSPSSTKPRVTSMLEGDQASEKYRRASATLSLADNYRAKLQYKAAEALYCAVVTCLVGKDPQSLRNHTKVVLPEYGDMNPRCLIMLIDTYRRLSSCALLQSPTTGVEQGLSWLEESRVALQNLFILGGFIHLHVWLKMPALIMIPPLCATVVVSQIQAAQIFKGLENSAQYGWNILLANRLISCLPENRPFASYPNKAYLESLLKNDVPTALSQRHPDPNSRAITEAYAYPNLQIRGTWKKQDVKNPEAIGIRSSYQAWIWKGHLYSSGGKMKTTEHVERWDIWRINLTRLERWEFVTKLPCSCISVVSATAPTLWRCRVYKDKVYFFNGNPTLPVFDLKKGKWSNLKTIFIPTAEDRRDGLNAIWPWPRQLCAEAEMQIALDRIFIFGGINGRSLTGSNLFMQLDLRTLKWKRLSGSPVLNEKNDSSMPGPRTLSSSWISRDEKKLFIFSSACHKSRPLWENQNGPPDAWVYDDLWSWDIEAGKWCQERIVGNPPSPRSSAGCTYSKILDKVVIFGGVNHMCFSRLGDSDRWAPAMFYADTFVYTPSKSKPSSPQGETANDIHHRRWKQVLTPGFPTYRYQCMLVDDPETGHIYLYGGEARGENTPTKNHTEVQIRKRATFETSIAETVHKYPALGELMGLPEIGNKTITKHFGDLWKLHLDIPGGDFESVDLEDEIRTAPPGPWQRCFECRKAGFWKKCGGGCNGRVFFCGRACQVKGWADHKRIHGCKKSAKP